MVGAPKKFCVKKLIMQELGRQPLEDIPEIADTIANNRITGIDLHKWTQAGIVMLLRETRLEDRE